MKSAEQWMEQSNDPKNWISYNRFDKSFIQKIQHDAQMNPTYTETRPNRLGYYWLKMGARESIVHVAPQRDFGGRLTAFNDDFKQWMPVDKFSDGTETVLWSGPIQPPACPPNCTCGEPHVSKRIEHRYDGTNCRFKTDL